MLTFDIELLLECLLLSYYFGFMCTVEAHVSDLAPRHECLIVCHLSVLMVGWNYGRLTDSVDGSK